MSTSIKGLNPLQTKFSINGKLAVLTYGTADKSVINLKYSQELTEQEDKDFKIYLNDFDII